MHQVIMLSLFILTMTLIQAPPAAATDMDVCATLRQSIRTLQGAGAGGSQWMAIAQQQLQSYGCLGDAPGVPSQRGMSYLDRMIEQQHRAPAGYPRHQLPSCAWILAQAKGNPVPRWMLENCKR